MPDMTIDAPNAPCLSCRSMKPLQAALRPRWAAALLFVLLLPTAASAQTFAVGAGGSLVNDTGTAADVRAFGKWGAHLFGEMSLEEGAGAVLQARVWKFGLPGSQNDSPSLKTEAATLSVGYFFREEWWRAGIMVGGGVYRLRPNDLEPGQVAADEKESSFGWSGALVTIFDVTPRWDLRLEAGGHLIRSEADHKTIFISGSVAYRF